jgi:putative transcriptional regulator
MSKVNKSILQGAREALAYAQGDKRGSKAHKVMVPKEIDVRAIRSHLKMSRAKFSNEFGFNARTLEKWEQGERHPDSTARAYLSVIKHSPNAVIAALHKQHKN